jgi:aryl-alcohol dehydrogenase-like predicted oxidoreductase
MKGQTNVCPQEFRVIIVLLVVLQKEIRMNKRTLGRTGLQIAPLVLGGNVFGWTADEKTSFELLDGFVAAGLNAVDTADIYSAWARGNQGGESETIIGKWFKRHPANRAKVVLITKVGSDFSPEKGGLSARWITQAIEDSLRRLQTDTIDLYLSHRPDPNTPYEETLAAFEKLLRAGKIRAVGTSNLDAGQLAESLEVARAHNLPRYDVLQPEYNLYDRASFDGALRDLTMREEIGVITYFSLAKGFLSGKYRSTDDLGKSPRGAGIAQYLNERGMRILAALDQVAEALSARPAEVALAWLIGRPGVTAPIASATNRSQLDSLVAATQLSLSAEQIALLERASS